jgi:hypothetical protein
VEPLQLPDEGIERHGRHRLDRHRQQLQLTVGQKGRPIEAGAMIGQNVAVLHLLAHYIVQSPAPIRLNLRALCLEIATQSAVRVEAVEAYPVQRITPAETPYIQEGAVLRDPEAAA